MTHSRLSHYELVSCDSLHCHSHSQSQRFAQSYSHPIDIDNSWVAVVTLISCTYTITYVWMIHTWVIVQLIITAQLVSYKLVSVTTVTRLLSMSVFVSVRVSVTATHSLLVSPTHCQTVLSWSVTLDSQSHRCVVLYTHCTVSVSVNHKVANQWTSVIASAESQVQQRFWFYSLHQSITDWAKEFGIWTIIKDSVGFHSWGLSISFLTHYS